MQSIIKQTRRPTGSTTAMMTRRLDGSVTYLPMQPHAPLIARLILPSISDQ